MPLSHSSKAEMATTDFSFAPKNLKNILLDYNKCEDDTMRGYGEEKSSPCRLPAIYCAGKLKHHTTKAKHSGRLKNTVYGAARALSA